MQLCHWQQHHHHMTLMASHDQKVILHLIFAVLILWNEMVLLMMLILSYETVASSIGIKLPKCLVAPHVNCLDLRKAVVPLTILSVWLDDWLILMVSPIRNVILHIILIILTYGMQRNYWLNCPHDMLLTPMQWHDMTPMPLE